MKCACTNMPAAFRGEKDCYRMGVLRDDFTFGWENSAYKASNRSDEK